MCCGRRDGDSRSQVILQDLDLTDIEIDIEFASGQRNLLDLERLDPDMREYSR